MNIAVLGSGNGGSGVGLDCAAHGHQVRLFDFEQFPESIKAAQKKVASVARVSLRSFSR